MPEGNPSAYNIPRYTPPYIGSAAMGNPYNHSSSPSYPMGFYTPPPRMPDSRYFQSWQHPYQDVLTSSTANRVDKFEAFQNKMRDKSDFEMQKFAGRMPSFQEGALRLMSLGIMNRRAARHAIGLAAPKYMDETDFRRFSVQESQRRTDQFQHQWFRSIGGFLGQAGRTISNITGTNELWENTGGRLDKEARSASRAADMASGTIDSIVDRADLVDPHFGRGIRGRKMIEKITERFANADNMQDMVDEGLISKEELRRFDRTGGTRGLLDYFNPKTQPFYSAEEQVQIMKKAAQMGEFKNIAAEVRDEKGNVFIPENEGQKAVHLEKLGKQIALRTRRMTANIAQVQKEFGIEDVGEAMKLLKAIAGDRGVDKPTPADLRNIKKMRDDLKITNEQIGQVFEAGRDIARQHGFSESRGIAIATGTQMLNKDMQQYGVLSREFVGQFGEGRVKQELTAAQTNFEKTDQGEIVNATRAQIAILRAQGETAQADALEGEMAAQLEKRGRISRELGARAMSAATGDRVGAGEFARRAEMEKTRFAEILSEEEGNQTFRAVLQAKVKRAQRVHSKDDTLAARMLAREMPGISKEMALEIVQGDPSAFDKAVDSAGRKTADTDVAADIKKISEQGGNLERKKRALKSLFKRKKLADKGFDLEALEETLEKVDEGDIVTTDEISERISAKRDWENAGWGSKTRGTVGALYGWAAGTIGSIFGKETGKSWDKAVGGFLGGDGYKAWEHSRKKEESAAYEKEVQEKRQEKKDDFMGKGLWNWAVEGLGFGDEDEKVGLSTFTKQELRDNAALDPNKRNRAKTRALEKATRLNDEERNELREKHDRAPVEKKGDERKALGKEISEAMKENSDKNINKLDEVIAGLKSLKGAVITSRPIKGSTTT